VKGSISHRILLFGRTGYLHLASHALMEWQQDISPLGGLLYGEFERCRLRCPPVRWGGTKDDDDNIDLFDDTVGTWNIGLISNGRMIDVFLAFTWRA
jgi:hypothetical protein